MPQRIERGHAVLTPRQDGRTKVEVCAAVRDGEPDRVTAVFFAVPRVRVAPGIRFASGASGRYTREAVEVRADAAGVLHLTRI